MKALINKNLKLIRYVWNINQEAMSALFPCSVSAYRSYELGAREPDVYFMCKLEELTGITIRRLWYNEISKLEIPEKPMKNGASDVNIDLNAHKGNSEIYEILKIIQQDIEALKKQK